MKQKLEQQKLQKVEEEIDLLLCPYYGEGERDLVELQSFVQDLKRRPTPKPLDQDYAHKSSKMGRSSNIQVVTDKNDFLNGKKFVLIKQNNKESRNKKKLKKKKKFLSQKRLFSKKTLNQLNLCWGRHPKNSPNPPRTQPSSKKRLLNQLSLVLPTLNLDMNDL